ncbi:MAG: outer membrane protein [Bradyrhizobium sp.]
MSKGTIVKAAFLAGAAFAALSGPAISGVLDAPPAYPVKSAYMAPVYDWTGFYVGISGGATQGRASWESDPDFTSGTDTHSSGLVGATIGYNAQNLGPLVVGTEFDFNWRNFDFTIPAATCGTACELRSSWFSTARLRFGYAIDRFLPYVTGGLSISDFTADTVGQPNGFSKNVSFNFTAGAGVEFAIYDSLRGKLEYLFVNHDSVACIAACNGPVNTRASENVLRVGLNYRLWQH